MHQIHTDEGMHHGIMATTVAELSKEALRLLQNTQKPMRAEKVMPGQAAASPLPAALQQAAGVCRPKTQMLATLRGLGSGLEQPKRLQLGGRKRPMACQHGRGRTSRSRRRSSGRSSRRTRSSGRSGEQ